jgi:hypothetical protein
MTSGTPISQTVPIYDAHGEPGVAAASQGPTTFNPLRFLFGIMSP